MGRDKRGKMEMLECQTGDDPATQAWKACMLPTYTTGTKITFMNLY